MSTFKTIIAFILLSFSLNCAAKTQLDCFTSLYHSFNSAKVHSILSEADKYKVLYKDISNDKLIGYIETYMKREYAKRGYLAGLSPRELPQTPKEFLVLDPLRESYFFLNQPMKNKQAVMMGIKFLLVDLGEPSDLSAREFKLLMEEISLLEETSRRLISGELTL
jgi:hypothetical protein